MNKIFFNPMIKNIRHTKQVGTLNLDNYSDHQLRILAEVLLETPDIIVGECVNHNLYGPPSHQRQNLINLLFRISAKFAADQLAKDESKPSYGLCVKSIAKSVLLKVPKTLFAGLIPEEGEGYLGGLSRGFLGVLILVTFPISVPILTLLAVISFISFPFALIALPFVALHNYLHPQTVRNVYQEESNKLGKEIDALKKECEILEPEEKKQFDGAAIQLAAVAFPKKPHKDSDFQKAPILNLPTEVLGLIGEKLCHNEREVVHMHGIFSNVAQKRKFADPYPVTSAAPTV